MSGFSLYEPRAGRWLTKDPIKFQGGDTNLYGYALNDPVNFFDANGLWSISASIYAGFGGGFTIGKNPDGGWFSGIRMGIGYGAGVSFDPDGKAPGNKCEPGMSTGA